MLVNTVDVLCSTVKQVLGESSIQPTRSATVDVVQDKGHSKRRHIADDSAPQQKRLKDSDEGIYNVLKCNIHC